MDFNIKEKIEEIVNKVKNDPGFAEKFKSNPVQAVESLLGADIPDDVTNKIADGAKAALAGDKAGGVVDKLKGMFG